jgi:hypothetical protein
MNELKTKILADLGKLISDYEWKKTAWTLVKPIIKEFDGKKCSKRVQTKLEKVLVDDYTVSYYNRYGNFNLTVSPKPWNRELNLDIDLAKEVTSYSKSDADIINFEELLKGRCCHYENLDNKILDAQEEINNLEENIKIYLEYCEKVAEIEKWKNSLSYTVRESFNVTLR